MNSTARLFLFALLATFALAPAHAQPLVDIENVLVGDAGNAANTAIPEVRRIDGVFVTNYFGSVAYEYLIGKYEVTIGQYTAFLNAVAASDPYGLYNTNMASDLHIAGISRSGSDGSYSYSVKNTVKGQQFDPDPTSTSNRPIAYVTWFDAARFVNWLHNGATNGADTETGAYTLYEQTNGSAPAKNPGAKCWIPTEDEWYKAAFYKGGWTNAGYWLYPPQSDTQPGNNIGGQTNQANYYNNGYAVTGDTGTRLDVNYLTDAGAFSNSPSPYGTYDQGGNLAELNDLAGGASTNRGLRGGSWMSAQGMVASGGSTISPDDEDYSRGFRVASAPATNTNPPVPPTIRAEEPVGTVLSNGATRSFGTLVTDSSTNRVFAIRNIGDAPLTSIALSMSGGDVGDFRVTGPATNAVAGGGESTTFTVTFAPAPVSKPSTSRSAMLTIASDDTNNPAFIINLTGVALNQWFDSDGDRLNDAAEFMLRDLGFDWQTAQPALVATLTNNANLANLFTLSQKEARYSDGFASGVSSVTNYPASYNLYTSNSVMDLRMGGLMVQKQGDNAVVTFQTETTSDLATLPFTNNGTPITNTIPMPGNKGFIRIHANP